MKRYLHFASCLGFAGAVALALSACVGHPSGASRLEVGQSREAVLARLGPPQALVRLPDGGERLQYSLQPSGQQAWMVDLDSVGKVVRSRQALDLANFSRIEPGRWTRDDVEREFGPPARIDRVSSWSGPIMTYRWNDGADMFYWVYLDHDNRVQRAHPGMEFFNAPDRD